MAAAAVPVPSFGSTSGNERGQHLRSRSAFSRSFSSSPRLQSFEPFVALTASTSSFVAPPSGALRVPTFKIECVSGEMKAAKHELLKVMISGAPASGKGTQCEYIVSKYGLLHISTGDLLRAEVAAGTENGLRAKEFMEQGRLVPDEIVIQMVKGKLNEAAAQGKGWLLDGFPRSPSQAGALEALCIKPDVFILLEVPEEVLIERVVGRRLDPVTGKIYHLKYTPPESDEVAARLTQRIDDTEAKAKVRLQSYALNVESLVSIYAPVMQKVDGNRLKAVVFEDIDEVLTTLQQKEAYASTGVAGDSTFELDREP